MQSKSSDLLVSSRKGAVRRTLDVLVRLICQQHVGAIVNEKIKEYFNLFRPGTKVTTRNAAYARMVDSFYELVTDFYEWGWGAS
jgi:hypothetical protein